ncbi:hypothetical protein GUJ93_ZPchr0012g19604 [Zizania palustris]|uniref:Uncharacterized protein n=1 Tax=Zizania palustris TaxID=103762 RepID=A0A8J5WXE4_ZIZPA|nr:hypothetical protein GUJ93_ZPchr0012g19604 [Zizania palustris]
MVTVGRACGGVDGGGATGVGAMVAASVWRGIVGVAVGHQQGRQIGASGASTVRMQRDAGKNAAGLWRGTGGADGSAVVEPMAALWRGASGGGQSGWRSKVGAWLEREKPWMRMRGESGENIGHPVGE